MLGTILNSFTVLLILYYEENLDAVNLELEG